MEQINFCAAIRTATWDHFLFFGAWGRSLDAYSFSLSINYLLCINMGHFHLYVLQLLTLQPANTASSLVLVLLMLAVAKIPIIVLCAIYATDI